MVCFFNDTATINIYALSLHDALPIFHKRGFRGLHRDRDAANELYLSRLCDPVRTAAIGTRSEEHTSELQSRPHLVCRLLLEKKNIPPTRHYAPFSILLQANRRRLTSQ